jgi:hypothetical protein
MAALRLAAIVWILPTMCCNWLVNRMAFFPDTSPRRASLPESVEEVFVPTGDGLRLQTFYLPRPDSRKLVLYFHGNASNLWHRMEVLLRLRELGVNVLGVSYRGYGASEGKPSEKGIYEDGRAAIGYAVDTLGFSLSNIFLFGRSIGSTVAVHNAQGAELAGIILVTPLSNARDHLKAQGLAVLTPLAPGVFDNTSKIDNVKCPVLIIHGTHDRTLPYAMGEKLFDRVKGSKELVTIRGGGHNDLEGVDPRTYWEAIGRFLEQRGEQTERATGK